MTIAISRSTGRWGGRLAQVTQSFQPPLYWQQFEDLTAGVVEAVYGVAQADRIGRPGQAQQGVDVHAAMARVGRIGVQCKRRDDRDKNNDPLPGGAVTRSVLLAEVREAEAFTPRVDLWILATTAKRDAHIQRSLGNSTGNASASAASPCASGSGTTTCPR